MDWNEVSALLSVIHQAAGGGPKYSKWAAEAEAELDKHWAAAHPPAPTPEPANAPEDDSVQFTGDDEAPKPNRRRF